MSAVDLHFLLFEVKVILNKRSKCKSLIVAILIRLRSSLFTWILAFRVGDLSQQVLMYLGFYKLTYFLLRTKSNRLYRLKHLMKNGVCVQKRVFSYTFKRIRKIIYERIREQLNISRPVHASISSSGVTMCRCSVLQYIYIHPCWFYMFSKYPCTISLR